VREHLIYWALPSLVILALLGMYFSDVPWLMEILAPRVNRELGVLENLQNLVLVILLGMMLVRLRHAQDKGEYWFFGFIAAAALFILMGELDYGTHFLWALQGWDWDTRPVFNIHNQGENSDRFKFVGNLLLGVFFVILPWFRFARHRVWLRFLQPNRWFLLSMAAMVLLSHLAHGLEDAIPPEPNYMSNSMSEYRELFTYYVWTLYFGILAFRRAWPGERAQPDTT
jgi:hypothetical protein